MNDKKTPSPTVQDVDQVSPDSLLNDFHGKPLFRVILFTVVVHVLFIGVFSVGYIKEQVFGSSTASMNREQKLDSAVKEGTAALREIAQRYDLNPEDLSGQFGGRTQSISTPDTSNTPSNPQDAATPPDTGSTQQAAPEQPTTEQPTSEIEKTLQHKEPGPEVPKLPSDEDDLFAPKAP
ncbi:MAG: hypothetical protein GC164_09680 [Phycisphaera sp.]|nr:hypothetical protein [Phycisphaera sp.]